MHAPICGVPTEDGQPRAAHSRHRGEIRSGAHDRVVADLQEAEVDAGAAPPRRCRGHVDRIAGRESDGGQQRFRSNRIANLDRAAFELDHFCPGDVRKGERQQARATFLHDPRHIATDPTPVANRPGRTDRGVAREWQLRRRRENAKSIISAAGAARFRQWQNENRLRKIEFPSHRLHRRRRQEFTVEHDRQWVSGVAVVGENVHDLIGQRSRVCHGFDANLANMASGTTTRVFLARLAGLSVLDPNADQVGRVRDVVVALRTEAQQPPRVLGLVVEVQPRRRVFIPMGQIRSIDADAVVVSGRINLRRFERRASETLVITELLDRRVVVIDGGATVIVVDVGMEEARTHDWFVTRIAVRSPGGGFRRRGQLRTLDWDQVSGITRPQEEQGAANLLAAFEQLKAPDLAHVMHELSAKRRAELAQALDDERLADVLEELPEDDQVQILAELDAERAADVLESMDPDDAADLLHELSPEEQERLLALMTPDEAEPVRRLLTYSEDTAGGMMTSEPVILPYDATVAEALARVRDPQLTPALASQVYVVRPPTETPTGKFLGIAHIQRLLREPPSSLVSGMVDNAIDPLRPDCPLADVTRHLATYNLVAVPIVDDGDHLLGAVTVDDVLDHLLPENWRERPTGEHGEPGHTEAAGHGA